MNLQQLEYIVAVSDCRNFAKAAAKCFVTQPTLSMMVQKLEEELEVRIFDRSRQPVQPTSEGEEVIRRARTVLAHARHLKDYVRELKHDAVGELHLGVIPTLAPYLLPLFLTGFHERFPKLKIFVKEMVTDDIIAGLGSGSLDVGLLATPLSDARLVEHPLFYEEFFAYASKAEKLPVKKYLLPKQINMHHLWLLEEGHCLRNQVFNLCELKRSGSETLNYEAGSIETLINLVDKNHGITIVPQLALAGLTAAQRKNLREFANPKPVREISLVASKDFPRKKIMEQLAAEITAVVPPAMIRKKNSKIITHDTGL